MRIDDEAYEVELHNLYKKDPYVYKNGTLKNKLGITDYEKLRQAEADISFVKLFTIDQDVKLEEFNIEYIQALHKYILGDVFDWAGEFRTVQMSKPEKILGYDSVRYALPSKIESNLKNTVNKLNKVNWKSKTLDEKIPIFTEGISNLWQIHPFRDGNTRTIVAYALRFAEEKGFKLDSSLILKSFAYMRGGFVWASQGEYSDYSYLNKIFKDAALREAAKNNNKNISNSEKTI